MIKVAIMGYGTVGSGVYEVFRTNKTSIDKKVGQELLSLIHILSVGGL